MTEETLDQWGAVATEEKSILILFGERNQEEVWNGLKHVPKISSGILRIPGQHRRSRRRKEGTPKFSAEERTENSDRLMDAEVRQRTKTKDIVEVAHSVKWKWGAHEIRGDQHRWAHVILTW
jgi:hypothetical protein